MKSKYELIDINDNLQTQIERFDNKASVLVTVVGIVFGLSLNFLGLFDIFRTNIAVDHIKAKFIILIILVSLYFAAFFIEIFFLISVIYPRKKKQGRSNVIYYGDIVNLNDDELDKAIRDFDNDDDNEYIKNQIKQNAAICMRKHRYFIKAIWCLIPVFAFMFSLIIMTFII